MDAIFQSALPVIRKLEAGGYEAYFVGGAVRDHLLKRPVHDVDIATSATPLEVKQLFKATVDVGIEHGTVIVLMNGESYEVTTFRAESEYVDYRRPASVAFIRSLPEDLRRRDFTINAMAMDGDGNIIDPFGGRQALNERVIETVGNAKERFTEDALRLMRALRFVSQLGFQLEHVTRAELVSHADLLQHIAIERIYGEMTKLLAGDFKKEAIGQAFATGLFKYWPSLFSNENCLTAMLDMPIQQLCEEEMWLLAVYLNDPKAGDQLKAWRMPGKKMKQLLRANDFLRERLKNDWDDVQLYRAGPSIFLMVERVCDMIQQQTSRSRQAELQERYENLPIKDRSQLAITGSDIMAEFAEKPGPWIGEWLDKAEEAVIRRAIPNERTAIKRWIQSWKIQSADD